MSGDKTDFVWILTVPHGKCISGSKSRMCDTAALDASSVIEKMLNKIDKNSRVVRVVSNRYRYEADLNRKSSEGEYWHKTWKDELKNNGFLLDVHSFNFNELCPECGAYFLESTPELTGDMSSKIGRYTGFPVFMGSRDNYITVTATESGMPAILVEFNESLDEVGLMSLCSELVTVLYRLKTTGELSISKRSR